LYYDDLVRAERTKPRQRINAAVPVVPIPTTTSAAKASATGSDAKNQGPTLVQALELVTETLDALMQERDENDLIWASMIKQAIKRRNPGFNERAHGFRSFNELLMEAQKRGLLKLVPDPKSGGYTVRSAEQSLP
jgi:hypothetical protein